MRSVSPTFLSKIKESSRNIRAKVVIGTTELFEENIVEFSVENSFGTSNMPTIGGVSSAKFNLKILNNESVPQIIIGVPIKPFVALETSTGVYEWIQIGTFKADYTDIAKTDGIITFECLDSMVLYDGIEYESALTFPATIQNMINEMKVKYGMTFSTQTLPTVSFNVKPKGTVRQILGLIASATSTNAVINSVGDIEFRFLKNSNFEFDSNNYIDFKLNSENQVKISQLTCTTDNEGERFIVGDGSGFALDFYNPSIKSESDLQAVYNRNYPLSFYSYTLKTQGFPHLEVGDIVSFTDKKDIIRTLCLVNHKLTYRGGLISEFQVDAPKDSSISVTPTGGSTLGQTVSKAISHATVELLKAVNKATGMITGNEGGYVVTVMDENGKPKELCMLDSEDVNTATKVWRWNKSGLGYSSTGYNGTYSTAITGDGQIVADFITTGTLSANVINGALLDISTNTSITSKANKSDVYTKTEVDSSLSGKANANDVYTKTQIDSKFTIQDGLISAKVSQVDVDRSISNIQIGGRNLLKESGEFVENSSYAMKSYYFGDFIPIEGEICTVTIKFNLGVDRTRLALYTSGGYSSRVTFGNSDRNSQGIASKTFTMGYYTGRTPAEGFNYITLYQLTSSGTSTSTVEWIKLERGNRATDWTPAPEDIQAEITNVNDNVTGVNEDLSERINTLTSSLETAVGSIEAKVDKTEYDSLKGIVDGHSTTLSVFDDKAEIIVSEYQKIAKIEDDLVKVESVIEDVSTHFKFQQTGLEISATDSSVKVNIAPDEFQILEGGVKTAYMNKQVMNIANANILTTLIVGVHQIEKYSNDITLIRWVGAE